MRLKLMEGVLKSSKGRVHHDLSATFHFFNSKLVGQELGAEAQGAREHFLNKPLHHLSLLAEETPVGRMTIRMSSKCMKLEGSKVQYGIHTCRVYIYAFHMEAKIKHERLDDLVI